MNDEQNKTAPAELNQGEAAADKEMAIATGTREEDYPQDIERMTAYHKQFEEAEHNIKHNPKLDPSSQEFDKNAWVKANNGRDLHDLLAELTDEMKTDSDALNKTLSDDYNHENVTEALQKVKEQMVNIADIVASGMQQFEKFRQSDVYQSIQRTIQYLIENRETIDEWLNEYRELEPFIDAEIKKPEYNGATIDELLADGTDENGEDIPDSLWSKAVNAARAARDRAQLPTATIKRADFIEYPLDKINSQIWNLLEKDTGSQLMFKAEKSGSKKELNIIYSIDFDEIEKGITITKRLLPFDKRVYIAISALFNAGNNVITLTKIYYAMGYTGNPGRNDLEKINNSISKMMGARIYVNNEQEAAAYKYNKFVYDGSLLPLERGTAVVNGQLADAAIHIFREPPVISFAKKRNQITTLDVKLLQSPISKTDANLLIDDYLIERIARAKNGKGQHRILYKTLYDKAGITTAKQKQRTPDKAKRYLEHYKKCGMITRYTMEADGITVYFK